MGCSGPRQVFTVSQDEDLPSSGQPACPVLACPHNNSFFLIGLEFLTLLLVTIACCHVAVYLQEESDRIFQYLSVR